MEDFSNSVRRCPHRRRPVRGQPDSAGLSANSEPSSIERVVARTVRNLAIPANARNETNPLQPTPGILTAARDQFIDRCAVCHGNDGSGLTQVGRNLYPKSPDLRASRTQEVTDGQIPARRVVSV